jgi:hypothetical protein
MSSVKKIPEQEAQESKVKIGSELQAATVHSSLCYKTPCEFEEMSLAKTP